jgi:hypothetical protein
MLFPSEAEKSRSKKKFRDKHNCDMRGWGSKCPCALKGRKVDHTMHTDLGDEDKLKRNSRKWIKKRAMKMINEKVKPMYE